MGIEGPHLPKNGRRQTWVNEEARRGVQCRHDHAKPRGSLGVQWGEGGGRFDSREFVKFVGFVVLRRGGGVTMRRSEEAGVAEMIEGGGEAFAFSALEVGGIFEEQRFAAVG